MPLNKNCTGYYPSVTPRLSWLWINYHLNQNQTQTLYFSLLFNPPSFSKTSGYEESMTSWTDIMTCHHKAMHFFAFHTDFWRGGEREHTVSALAMVIHHGDKLH